MSEEQRKMKEQMSVHGAEADEGADVSGAEVIML